MTLVLTALLIFGLLVLSELWWRRHRPNDEFSRKFIHIFVGSLVAFAPFFLGWPEIIILSVGFIGAVIVSKYFNIFQSIHAVERPTWGEVYFALAVGVLAFMTRDPWIYAAALLHMSLADGFAAVIGVTYGKTNRYKVFGHPKSIAGSATFFVLSVAILITFSSASIALSIPVILGLAALTTAVENMGVRGLDNLLVPIIVAVTLSQIS